MAEAWAAAVASLEGGRGPMTVCGGCERPWGYGNAPRSVVVVTLPPHRCLTLLCGACTVLEDEAAKAMVARLLRELLPEGAEAREVREVSPEVGHA